MRNRLFKWIIFTIVMLLGSFTVQAQVPNAADAIAWNADGSYIAVAYVHGQIDVWETATHQIIWSEMSDYSPAIDWHPSNPSELAYIASEGDLYVVDIQTDEQLLHVPFYQWTNSIDYHPDGTHLLVGANEREIGPRQENLTSIVDLATGETILQLEQIYLPTLDAQWHPDGEQIWALNDGEIQIWDATTGLRVARSEFVYEFMDEIGIYRVGQLREFAISIRDPTLIVIADPITIGHVTMPNFAQREERLISGLRALALSPDDSFIATIRSVYNIIQIHDTYTLNITQEIITGEPLRDVAWHPTEPIIAYGTEYETREIIYVPIDRPVSYAD